MKLLVENLDLSRFLYLLSFNCKDLTSMGFDEAQQLREDFRLVHTHFIKTDSYTTKLRLSLLGKCSSNIDRITKTFDMSPLTPPLLPNTLYKSHNKKSRQCR